MKKAKTSFQHVSPLFKKIIQTACVLSLFIFTNCDTAKPTYFYIPYPSNLSYTAIGPDSITVHWPLSTQAVDRTHTPGIPWFDYQEWEEIWPAYHTLYHSILNNIQDLEGCENNGSILVKGDKATYTVSGLLPGTRYYFNVVSMSYNDEYHAYNSSSASTFPIPQVTTHEIKGMPDYAKSIAGTSATGGGDVTTPDEPITITDRGVCWSSTNAVPTIADSKDSDLGSYDVFSNAQITGLTEDTTYYVRAYATDSNSVTGYGEVVTFNSGKTFGTELEGGYLFYNDGEGGGMVVAATDQSSSTTWSNITTASVTTSRDFGTGQANTTAIIDQSGHTASAAQLCDVYNGGGYDDWFLPSLEEALAIVDNLHTGSLSGFTATYYWTSSEDYDIECAKQVDVVQEMPSGDQKNNNGGVRAVRIFP